MTTARHLTYRILRHDRSTTLDKHKGKRTIISNLDVFDLQVVGYLLPVVDVGGKNSAAFCGDDAAVDVEAGDLEQVEKNHHID